METKFKLIKAYEKLILKYEGDNFTVLDVCKEAGVSSKGTFYHYFDSKTELLSLLGTKLNDEFISTLKDIKNEHIKKEDRVEKWLVFLYIKHLKIKS